MHPGLLPRYSGPNPMGWALRNGDREMGMTIHRMTSEIDSGPILAQGVIPVTDAGDAELRRTIRDRVPRGGLDA